MSTTITHVTSGEALSGAKRGTLCLALISSILVLSSSPPAQAQSGTRMQNLEPGPTHHDDPRHHPHLGMWVTADGHIRHELLPNGRYDEQRGQRKHAYQGRYWVKGHRIAYLDDTGFTADGEFREGRFFHGGYVFFRERVAAVEGK